MLVACPVIQSIIEALPISLTDDALPVQATPNTGMVEPENRLVDRVTTFIDSCSGFKEKLNFLICSVAPEANSCKKKRQKPIMQFSINKGISGSFHIHRLRPNRVKEATLKELPKLPWFWTEKTAPRPNITKTWSDRETPKNVIFPQTVWPHYGVLTVMEKHLV